MVCQALRESEVQAQGWEVGEKAEDASPICAAFKAVIRLMPKEHAT